MLFRSQGSLRGDLLSRNKEFRSQVYVFGQVSWAFSPKFKGVAGLTLNRTQYDFRDLLGTGGQDRSARRDFDPVLLPSLDLRYTFAPGNWVYLNISRGFSNPSLEESLNPDGVINPEIGQEKGMNYEVGGRASWFGGRLQGSLALYQMEIRDLLVADRVGEDQFIGRNAGSTRHRGLEMSLQYAVPSRGRIALSPFLSYTYNGHRFREFVDGDSDYSGNELTGVPDHQVYAGLQVTSRQGWYWNSNYQYVGAIPLTDSNALYSDPYHLLNTQLGYRRQWGERFNLGLELGINNIMDTRYASSVLINARGFGGSEPRYYYPGNGRNFYVGILLLYDL